MSILILTDSSFTNYILWFKLWMKNFKIFFEIKISLRIFVTFSKTKNLSKEKISYFIPITEYYIKNIKNIKNITVFVKGSLMIWLYYSSYDMYVEAFRVLTWQLKYQKQKIYQKKTSLTSLITFWHSELHTQFQLLKIIHFSFKIFHFSFKILTKLRKFTCLKITLIFRPLYDHECTNFFCKKFFCKIINATRSLHKKKFFWYELEKWYFLIW